MSYPVHIKSYSYRLKTGNRPADRILTGSFTRTSGNELFGINIHETQHQGVINESYICFIDKASIDNFKKLCNDDYSSYYSYISRDEKELVLVDKPGENYGIYTSVRNARIYATLPQYIKDRINEPITNETIDDNIKLKTSKIKAKEDTSLMFLNELVPEIEKIYNSSPEYKKYFNLDLTRLKSGASGDLFILKDETIQKLRDVNMSLYYPYNSYNQNINYQFNLKTRQLKFNNSTLDFNLDLIDDKLISELSYRNQNYLLKVRSDINTLYRDSISDDLIAHSSESQKQKVVTYPFILSLYRNLLYIELPTNSSKAIKGIITLIKNILDKYSWSFNFIFNNADTIYKFFGLDEVELDLDEDYLTVFEGIRYLNRLED